MRTPHSNDFPTEPHWTFGVSLVDGSQRDTRFIQLRGRNLILRAASIVDGCLWQKYESIPLIISLTTNADNGPNTWSN